MVERETDAVALRAAATAGARAARAARDGVLAAAGTSRLVLALRLLALLVVALQLAAPLANEAWAWGIWPSTYLPAGLRWLLAAVAIFFIVAGDQVAARLAPALDGPAIRGAFGPGWPRLRLAIAALSVVPFYLFRIVHTRWGDAYILVNAIPHPEVRLTYTWQAPLDVFIHAKTWALGNSLFGWPDATPAYSIWSALAGGAFVWVLLGLARWMGRNRAERWWVLGLIGTLGTMQLFFGYVENYTLVAVGLLAYGWLALLALRGEAPVLWAATALALSHAVNPSTVFVAPSLLFVAWYAPVALPGNTPREACSRPGWRALAAAGLPYLLVGLGVLALMTAGSHGLTSLQGADAPGGGDHNWFVPLFRTTTRWEHYTMFSIGHLSDILNEQLLVAPVVWPGMLLSAIFAWRLIPGRNREFRFLFLYAGLYALLILTWNADFGGQRDWDLFSLAAIPAALLFAYTLPRALVERPALTRAGMALVAAQAYHTVTWIYQNTRPWEWPKN